METVIGLNLDHHNTCRFTESVGGEGLRELNEFMHKVLVNSVQLVAIRLRERRLRRSWQAAVRH